LRRVSDPTNFLFPNHLLGEGQEDLHHSDPDSESDPGPATDPVTDPGPQFSQDGENWDAKGDPKGA
jgi:hypothetical protein